MAKEFKQTLIGGVDLDADQTKIEQIKAMFIKNMTLNSNANPNAAALAGNNLGVYTPLEGNTLLPISLPGGTNYCCGFFSAEQTNEGYAFVYNSTQQHTILVIGGDNGIVTKVYQGSLLPFILNPQFFFSKGRVILELRSFFDKSTGQETNFKFLIFTNNFVNQFLVSVDDSIATNSFSTGYFTATSAFYNPIELIHLGVPTPLKTIGLNTPVPYTPTAGDLTMQNILVRNGWQFRVKFIDIYGRESEHGIISDQYLTIIGGGCLTASNGLPRCVMINFDAGNPLVNQIQIEYRQWKGDDRAGALATNWQLYETFNKYDNSAAVKWYSRSLNPIFTTAGSGITINAGTNTISYVFCGDKNAVPIDPNETSRTEPGLPRISAAVFPINKALGLANNVRGFEPIAPDLVDKVVFGVQQPSPASVPCPAPPTRTIVIYANIYNPYGDYSAICRQSFGKYVFGNSDSGDCGGGSTAFLRGHVSSMKLGQIFGDQQNPGFIGYLAGTPYKCISEQVDFDVATGATSPRPITTPGISFPHEAMQKFTFTGVPAGIYVFRIAGHKATINDPDYQKTSTYVAGVVPFFDLSIPGNRRVDMAQFPHKELIVNVSAGDYGTVYSNADPMFLILDLGDGVRSGAVDGYIHECPGGAPVEMLPIEIGGLASDGTINDGYGSFFTDHNGFYFVTCGSTRSPYAGIWADLCDGQGFRSIMVMYGTRCAIQHGNGTGSIAGHCWGDDGDWTLNGALYLNAGVYDPAGRRVIKQKVVTCNDPNIGVPGVPMVLTKCGTGITDGGGMVTLIAHNRYAYNFPGHTLPYLGGTVPDYSGAPNNQDILIFSQKGGCTWNDCNSCNTYIGYIFCQYIACGGASIGCTGTQPPRTLCLNSQAVKMSGVGLFGCQTGGKYPVAFILHDEIGRHTAPQRRQGQKAFVTMPNLNDAGYTQFALPGINVTIDPTFAVDPKFKRITFCVGANVLFRDFFSWAADWVQPVDNTGETNSVNPTAIRIYYGSLNEYNKQHNFFTNTGWQLLTNAPSGNPPAEADVVQFIMNGDGAWLPSVISAPISYDKSGLFFTIPYLPELATLKNECLFRVIRPAQNQSGDMVPLYEQSVSVELVNGVPQTLSLILPYFDSYLLSRLIPTPRLKGQTGPISPAAFPITPLPIQYTSTNQDATLLSDGYSTSNVNNSNGVVIFDVKDDPVSVPFYCESPSPADDYCSHLSCRGRVFFPNPQEAQQRSGTEVALSDKLLDRGMLNYLSYFESQNVMAFDRNAWGDIIAVFVETSFMLVITERDNFVVSYNSSSVRTDSKGNVISQNQYGIFSAPERKAGTNYGCDPQDINTIARCAGRVCWLDRSGYVVFHNFSVAQAVQFNGYDAYIKNKISKQNLLNQNQNVNGLTYWIADVNPKNWEYVLSWFNIPAAGLPSYINNSSVVNPALNETLIIDLEKGILKGMASFTPEYYGSMSGFYLQSNFLTFKNGKPYIHHNGITGTAIPYNKFYGVQCKKILTIVVNGGPESESVKRFMWNEVYCKEHKFIVIKVETESGQLSRILDQLWDFRNKFWASDFKCDLNTVFDPALPAVVIANPLYEGNTLYGRHATVTYQSLDADDPLYCELSALVNYYIEETNGAK